MASMTDSPSRKNPENFREPEESLDRRLLLPENEARQGEGGLRTKGCFKRSHPGKPLISIVTVVYNGEEHLEETIRSVLGQSYDNVEYIVIDGGSTDGTVDIIRQYEEGIDYWVSEPDEGIYDAMNKGIMLAGGEMINFMNSGDMLYDKTTLGDVAAQIAPDTDLIYGDAEMRYRTFRRKRTILPLPEMYRGMPFSHQSMYARTALHREYPYDLSYSLCADYDFICKMYVKKKNFKRMERLTAACSTDGLSDKQSAEILRQTAQISYKHFPSLSVKVIYAKKIVINHMKIFFKRYLPESIVETIRRIK